MLGLRPICSGALDAIPAAQVAAGSPFVTQITERPALGKPLPQSLRTHLDGFRLPLFNQDTMYIRAYDWPLPKVPPKPNTGFVQPSGIIISQPLKPFDWPLPIRDKWKDRTWINTGPISVPPGTPVLPFDWPLPIRTRWMDRTWINTFGPLTITPAAPIIPGDWPLPIRPKWLDRTWLNTFGPQTISGNSPLNNYDWSLPRRTKQPDGTWISTFVPAQAVSVPVQNYDWSLPRRPRAVNFSWLNTFIPQGPITPTVWPLPVRQIFRLLDWPRNNLLPAAGTLPPGQSAMPIPRQKPFMQTGISITIPPAPVGAGPRAFVQIVG